MSAALTRLVENLDLPPKEAGEAILAYLAEVLRDAAAFVEFWHGQAPDVFSPLDSAALLRHIAGGGNPKDTPYP